MRADRPVPASRPMTGLEWEPQMTDIIFILLTFVFFLATWGLVEVLERVRGQ